jgi:hypothetical protein
MNCLLVYIKNLDISLEKNFPVDSRKSLARTENLNTT